MRRREFIATLRSAVAWSMSLTRTRALSAGAHRGWPLAMGPNGRARERERVAVGGRVRIE